jgi:hypothetical protein
MGGSKTVIEKPDAIDPAESMGEYLFGSGFKNFKGITDPRLQKRILAAEKQFRPQYTALELGDQEAALFGRDGQAGLIDLQQRAGERAIGFEEEAKRGETALLGELGGDVTEALRSADPYSTELAEQTRRRALGQLTPDEERDIQQQARQAAAARGRTGASADFGEVLARRQFTDQYTQPAFQMSRAIGGDPSQFLFGRPTQQTAFGSSLFGQAANIAAQQQGPQLFDPNAGINLAMQQRSQDMSLLGAQAQADATRSAGRSSAIGSIAGSIIGLCWVAREVYGIENPRWLSFRQWMLVESPSWFRNLYIKHGERFAKFISNKPFIKNIIRKWMDTKIS